MTDYIERINNTSMEGDVFDGQLSYWGGTVFENVKFSADQWKTYSLEDIIPKDGYDYEVRFGCTAVTGSTSGNKVECRIYSGTATSSNNSNNMSTLICRAITRASNTQQPAGTGWLIIKSGDRKVTFNNTDGSGTTGNVSLYVQDVRRLGTNFKNPDTNYISNISTPS